MKRALKKHLYAHKNKQLRRNFPLLAMNEFFAELRFYYPVAVLVFESVTGSFATAMAVFSVLMMSQALFEIPTGVFSDKIGRKKTVVVGSFAELFGTICYSIAFFVPFGTWLLFLGSMCFGFANSLFSGNNDALIYETLSAYKRSDEMPQIYGQLRAMGQAALALSGIIAAVSISLGYSYERLVFLSLVPSTISLIFNLMILEPPRKIKSEHNSLQHMHQSFVMIMKNPKLLKLAIATSLKNGTGDTTYALGPAFVEMLWPSWMTPLFRTMQNLCGMIGFMFAGSIVKALGLIKSLYLGTLYSFGFYFAAYITAAFYSPFLILTTQISYAVSSSADTTLQQHEFTDQQRATMGSIIAIVTKITASIGSVLIGVLADLYGVRIASIIMLSIASISVPIYFTLFKAEKESKVLEV